MIYKQTYYAYFGPYSIICISELRIGLICQATPISSFFQVLELT